MENKPKLFCEKGRTKQSFRDQCNINNIVDKARKTGLITHQNSRTPVYQDCTKIPNYQESLEIVIHASNMFSELDARTRERFSNDPAKMIEFLQNEDNIEEAVKLGLVNPPAEPEDNTPAEPTPK